MILVSGEALIDLFIGAPGAEGFPAEAIAGGSPFNVAIGIGRLGRPSAFLSTLSEDVFGGSGACTSQPLPQLKSKVPAKC
jgi:fructokinase